MSYWDRRLKKEEIQGYINPPKNKEELISRLIELNKKGWIQTRKQINDGVIGHILEDYLGIKENNISLPDAGKYELKTQRLNTSSLTTLFHLDPWPRKPKSVVSNYLGPVYGWPHETIEGEWSFRVTMYGHNYTNRGFKISIDKSKEILKVEFDPLKVTQDNELWLKNVLRKSGGRFSPVPYWLLNELEKKLKEKINNIIYINGRSRKVSGFEEFKYEEAIIYEEVGFDEFLSGIESGYIYVDFDARTNHNHGTKFRIRQGKLEELYSIKLKLF